jgi:formylglycine-generating enzyme required for sulfatase activity
VCKKIIKLVPRLGPIAIVLIATIVAAGCSDGLSGIGFRDMVSIPVGKTFLQKAVGGIGESFEHTVSGFELAKYETTYELWYAVRKWALGHGYFFAFEGIEGQDGHGGNPPVGNAYQPVTAFNWRDAIVFCNAYSEMTGLDPVYYTDREMTKVLRKSGGGNEASAVDKTPGSSDNPFVKWDSDGYRLPTEGEWQYAASYIDGETWTPCDYASGAAADYTNSVETGKVAWYNDSNSSSALRSTEKVGTKAPNKFGIYDMSGNLHEYCWDWYAPYPKSPQTDYRGPETGMYRTMRGSTWSISAASIQIGCRCGFYTYRAVTLIGIRLARSLQAKNNT